MHKTQVGLWVGGAVSLVGDSNFYPYITLLRDDSTDIEGKYLQTTSTSIFYAINIIKERKSGDNSLYAFATPRDSSFDQVSGVGNPILWI